MYFRITLKYTLNILKFLVYSMSYYLIFSVLQSEDICETCGVVDVRGLLELEMKLWNK